MKVIQNFSSKTFISEFPITDIMIWYIGLIKLRDFGYTIKLYCEKKDFEFLKKWGLYDVYDEIDDTFLTDNKMIKMINGDNFWSIRKIECINHEFETSDEPFIYMDTDIILNEYFEPKVDTDLIVWSPETQEKIYIPWTHLSIPAGYIMPEYIYKTNEAYNCGILYFRTKKLFAEYRKQYLNFTLDNPCTTSGVEALPGTIKNIWACNAEQRILRAVADYRHWHVQLFMDYQGSGICEQGIHYYFMRGFWRILYVKEITITDEFREQLIFMMNDQLKQMLALLAACDREALYRFLEIDWVKDFYENGTRLTQYR